MKPKRSLASVLLELAAVLLVTALAFAWGVQTAQAERGYTAIGGEYLFLLLPFMYYPGKRDPQAMEAGRQWVRQET